MVFDVTDLDIMARTVMAEAEGETFEGKIAVAAVIITRARNPGWWGHSVKGVCLAPLQFSSWNATDERRKVIGDWRLVNDPVFRDCYRACLEAFDFDPTGGADSFYAHKVVNPEWADGLDKKVIGNHTFVRTR